MDDEHSRAVSSRAHRSLSKRTACGFGLPVAMALSHPSPRARQPRLADWPTGRLALAACAPGVPLARLPSPLRTGLARAESLLRPSLLFRAPRRAGRCQSAGRGEGAHSLSRPRWAAASTRSRVRAARGPRRRTAGLGARGRRRKGRPASRGGRGAAPQSAGLSDGPARAGVGAGRGGAAKEAAAVVGQDAGQRLCVFAKASAACASRAARFGVGSSGAPKPVSRCLWAKMTARSG